MKQTINPALLFLAFMLGAYTAVEHADDVVDQLLENEERTASAVKSCYGEYFE